MTTADVVTIGIGADLRHRKSEPSLVTTLAALKRGLPRSPTALRSNGPAANGCDRSRCLAPQRVQQALPARRCRHWNAPRPRKAGKRAPLKPIRPRCGNGVALTRHHCMGETAQGPGYSKELHQPPTHMNKTTNEQTHKGKTRTTKRGPPQVDHGKVEATDRVIPGRPLQLKR